MPLPERKEVAQILATKVNPGGDEASFDMLTGLQNPASELFLEAVQIVLSGKCKSKFRLTEGIPS